MMTTPTITCGTTGGLVVPRYGSQAGLHGGTPEILAENP